MKDIFRTRFPLNLQFFAEGGDGGDDKTKDDDKPNENDKTKDQETTKDDNKTKDDTDVIKKQAVQEYLKSLGVDTEGDLSDIVSKHKEEEEKNLSQVEKIKKKYDKAILELASEREKNVLLEAQIEAVKLGAKPKLIEDLVAVAKSRTSEGKDIKSVILEIKNGETGSIYFGSDQDDSEDTKGRTVTRRDLSDDTDDSDDSDDVKRKKRKGSIAASFFEDKKASKNKSAYWGR